MAYQPKSYKKFVATAATATLVATAVVPAAFADEVKTSAFTDVPTSYEAAIDYVVKNSFSKGLTETTYGIGDSIKRGDAAIIIANAAGLNDKDAPSAGFGDVPTRGALAINSLKAAGVVNGKTATNFGFGDSITRGEAAIMLQRAFDLKAGTTTNPFSDVSDRYDEAVSALVNKGVTQGINATQFGTQNPIKRGDFAKFIYALRDVIVLPDAAPVLNYTGTSPINVAYGATFTAPVVTATDDKDTNVAVTSVIKNASGATVSAIDTKVPGTYTITYSAVDSDGNKAKDLVVTVIVAAELGDITSVDLNATTFDDDTAGQVVTFTVNGGQAVNTEDLRQRGYAVNFVAVNSDTGATANIFANPRTGLLNTEVPVGDYTVEIQITKGGVLVVSDKEVITVTDLESTVTAITGVSYETTAGVELNSTTLVTGESARIDSIIANAAGKSNVSLPVTSAEVTSSNPSVISVSGQTLTANSTGTAVITVKVGNATTTTTFTVTNAARAVETITSSEATVKLVQGSSRTLAFTAVDQYGDPIAIPTGDTVVVEDFPQTTAGAPIVGDAELVTGPTGETTLTLTGVNVGSGTVRFEDTNNEDLGSVNIQVTNVNNVASTRVETTAASLGEDNTFAVGRTVSYQVTQLNSEGAYNGVANLGATGSELRVVSSNPAVATVGINTVADFFNVTGVSAGTTTISVRNAADQVVHQFNVTITASGTVITGVNFTNSATAINYAGEAITVEDILDVRPDAVPGAAARDRIVYGVEHNANTVAKVRLTGANVLYLDTNTGGGTEGAYNATNDVLLGLVTAEVLTGATNMPVGALANINAGSTTAYVTEAGDKGSILFRILVESNGVAGYQNSEAVATTTINVDVPVSPVTPPVTPAP